MVLNVIFSTIFITPAIWLSGRVVVGGKKAKLVDAIFIAAIGTVVGGIFGTFFSGVIAAVTQLIIWLALIRHYYECGWGTAFGIAILAIMIFVGISIILGVVGFTLFSTLLV